MQLGFLLLRSYNSKNCTLCTHPSQQYQFTLISIHEWIYDLGHTSREDSIDAISFKNAWACKFQAKPGFQQLLQMSLSVSNVWTFEAYSSKAVIQHDIGLLWFHIVSIFQVCAGWTNKKRQDQTAFWMVLGVWRAKSWQETYGHLAGNMSKLQCWGFPAGEAT